MKVISIDPGETTGIIIFETKGREFISSDAGTPEEICRRIPEIAPEQTIIEADPFFSGYNATAVAMIMLTITRYPCAVIGPGEWKPIAKAQKWKRSFETPHENDAYCMLRYWFLKVFKEDIGDPQ